MSNNKWTAEQRTKLYDWAKQKGFRTDDGIQKILTKKDFTNEDLNYLRSFPGFSKVESQIVPVSKSSLAKKLASEYSSIDKVPKAFKSKDTKQ